jgi:hypothetical protein
MARFYRIACTCASKKKGPGKSNWLGSICIDYPNVSYDHCKLCNSTWFHKVTSDGTVYRTRVLGKIEHVENVAVIEVEAK